MKSKKLLVENLSKDKRKRDVGFYIAGKRLRHKYWQFIYEKTCEDEEDEEKKEKRETISVKEDKRRQKMMKKRRRG